jgi:serine/threonine protein kinase/ankyrin repeat protein
MNDASITMEDALQGVLLGNYEIVKRLGQGGMGAVYLARHVSLERTVAIKILLPELASNAEYVERFLREARTAGTLNHPNIVQIHDASVHENLHFFVMEFIEGINLKQLLQERGFLEEVEALKLIQQAAHGLAYAHSKHIVHRDIKPENLLLTPDSVIKIADLGLAKWKSSETDITLTVTGTTMGTPYYMSPEQIRGVKDIDGRADIYSLGMTLYHLLAGRPAFPTGTAAEIMAAHLSDMTPASMTQMNPNISEKTSNLIEGMTRKEREERFPEMAAVIYEICKITGEPLTSTPATLIVSPVQKKRKKTLPWNKILTTATAAIVIVVLTIIAVARWKKRMSDDPSLSVEVSQPTKENATPQESPTVSLPALTSSPQKASPPKTAEKHEDLAPTMENVWIAARTGNVSALQYLATKGLDFNTPDEQGKTALIYGCQAGHVAVVEFLLSKNVSTDERGQDGWSALMHAASRGHGSIVQKLLKQNVNLEIKDAKGETALIKAIVGRHPEIGKDLVESRADVHAKDAEGHPAIILAAFHGYADLVKALLDRGANVDEKDPEGNTALMEATTSDVVKKLISGGANIKERNSLGLTSLLIAAQKNRVEALKALLDHGVSVDEKGSNDGSTALMYAATTPHGSTEALEALLNQGANLNAKNLMGQTPLICSVNFGDGKNLEAIRILIEKGCELNVKDLTGTSALMYAAALNQQEISRALTSANAELDPFSAAALGDIDGIHRLSVKGTQFNGKYLKDVKYFKNGAFGQHLSGCTPLIGAAMNGHVQAVQWLLDHGSSPSEKTDQNISALSIAQQRGFSEVVDLLTKAGAKD